MKKYRYLLMTATLWMSAQAGFAMSPSVASLQALYAAGQAQASVPADPACPCEEYSLQQISASTCPVMAQCPWLSYLFRQGVSTCQRLSSACGRNAMGCQSGSACCEAADRDAACAAVRSAACAAARATGGSKSCCAGGHEACCADGTDAAQAPKCCCAKGCACCESCKKTQTEKSACEHACPQQASPRIDVTWGCEEGSPLQASPRFDMVWGSFLPPVPFFGQCQPPIDAFDSGIRLPDPYQHKGPWVLPVPSPRGWIGPQPQVAPNYAGSYRSMQIDSATSPRIIAVPTASMPPFPYHLIHEVAPGRNAAQAQHAHLVTPDLEAHCERMIHKGEMIMLEGEVRLVSRKNGQHIRIEAHRVLLNMNDGTFTVESDVCPMRTSQRGVSRMSGENTPMCSPHIVVPTSALERTTFHGIQVFSVPIPSQQIKFPAVHGEIEAYSPR